MDPILKYPGAKWRLAPWIIEHMPPHEGYLEPWGGSLAVFFNKPKSRVETINDLDGNIVRCMIALRLAGRTQSEIGQRMGYVQSKVSRELRRACDRMLGGAV